MGYTYRRTLAEYKADFKAAFGPKNKQRVLMAAAKDKDLSVNELVRLRKWVQQQGYDFPEDTG